MLRLRGTVMTFRKQLVWAGAACAVALANVPSTAVVLAPVGSGPAAPAPARTAQGRGRGAPLYTPAAGAKDLKSVLFNWAWYTGMLRSSEEYDLLMTLEYQ